MAKKRATKRLGHAFTSQERNDLRHAADVQEELDGQFLVARDALHQYVAIIAARQAANAGQKLPSNFTARRNAIVGKVVQLIQREVAAHLKKS